MRLATDARSNGAKVGKWYWEELGSLSGAERFGVSVGVSGGAGKEVGSRNGGKEAGKSDGSGEGEHEERIFMEEANL